jgi:hypothetical protein
VAGVCGYFYGYKDSCVTLLSGRYVTYCCEYRATTGSFEMYQVTRRYIRVYHNRNIYCGEELKISR